LNKKTVEAQKRLYGEEDRRTLKSKAQLANVYTLQNRLTEATALFEEVIPVNRRVLGNDDRDTITALNDLAVLYSRQGRKTEATRVFEEILERRRRVLGEDHPDTVLAMNNVSYCYQEAGRFDEAKQLLERAAVIGERIWGPKHPSYGLLLHTLGEIETARGDVMSTETYLVRAHDIYVLQPNFEHLPVLLYELAQVSARRGNLGRAIDFLEAALARGYKTGGSTQAIADDPAFAPLRSNSRFLLVLTNRKQ
jgi:non-specific serine/threonine protein kinase/serine/threonine-protein kinase